MSKVDKKPAPIPPPPKPKNQGGGGKKNDPPKGNDKPAQAKGNDKPAQAKGNDKPAQVKGNDKPAQVKAADSGNQVKGTDKQGAGKPGQGKGADKAAAASFTGAQALAKAAKADLGALPFATEKGRSADTQALLDQTAKALSPKGQKSLEKLAEAGILDKPAKHGEPPLGQQVKRFLDKGGSPQLAEDTLEAIGNAAGLRQARKNTCAAATAEANWAQNQPSEYFRAATDLATKGETTLKRGKNDDRKVKLQVDEAKHNIGGKKEGANDNQKWIKQNKSGEAAVHATVQTALMNHGSEGYYDIKADKHSGKKAWGEFNLAGGANTTGLSYDGAAKLNKDVTGVELGVKVDQRVTYSAPKFGGNGSSSTTVRDVDGEMKNMRATTQEGKRFNTVIHVPEAKPTDPEEAAVWQLMGGGQNSPKGAHAVTVTAVDQGKVTFQDPKGGAVTLPEGKFRKLMEAVDMNALGDGGIGGWTGMASYASSWGGRR
ncbi:MAG: hypothetical protein VKP62_12245 [Candidatus Sericytochromatia bacterium]|nr:hypothetical protein [Candidatus Sericytochromatia bacterium]